MAKASFEFLQFLFPLALIVILPIPDILKYIFIGLWGVLIIWWLDDRIKEETFFHFFKSKFPKSKSFK